MNCPPLSLLSPPSPANSTTQAVKDFYNYYHGKNDSMITDQFNPFMRESTPPLLIDASAETHVTWGRCSFLGIGGIREPDGGTSHGDAFPNSLRGPL